MHRLLTARAGGVIVAVALIARVVAGGQTPAPPAGGDWPLHNLDVENSRYSPLAEINTSNASRLTVRWTFDVAGTDNIAQATPLVVNGTMYFNSGSKLFALDAATGRLLWTLQATQAFVGGGRGPAYGDGRIYAYGRSVMYAVDAKTGKLVESFGEKGLLRLVNNVLDYKYPGRFARDLDPTTLGYSMTNPPTYHRGVLYVGLPFSDSLLPGGLIAAMDGTTGAIRWVFNTVPQGPRDEGWEIARDTWSGSGRYGGGIWTTPSIDPQLGRIYFNAANPSPNYDGSSRKGANLFTNALIALDLATGRLVWHYQVIHHDIWDWDLVGGPVLFDVRSGGRTVRGVASAGKNCHMYFFDRETGRPLNPIVETPVPTTTDVPGDVVWPTQPIPYTATGVPLQPLCATYPIVADPALAVRVRPSYYPYQAGEFVITSPGNTGGANYGSPSFSRRTGLLYVNGQNDAWSIKVKPVGDTLKSGPGNQGHFGVIAERGETGMKATTALSAYAPATGERVWYRELPGERSGGNLVTAGDVVFLGVSTGDFYAVDARSGSELLKITAKRGIRASPLTYQAGGRQYVSVVATNSVLTLGLP